MNTYYIENKVVGKEKRAELIIDSQSISNYVSKQSTIKLPLDCFNTILKDSIAAVPYNNYTYLITKNKIYKISGTKIIKTLKVPGVERCTVTPGALYLFSKDGYYILDAKDNIARRGDNVYRTLNLDNILPNKAPINDEAEENAIKTIQDSYNSTISRIAVFPLGFQFSNDYCYAQVVFADGKTKDYLLAEGCVLELPEGLKNKKFTIYKTTSKEYGSAVKKYFKLVISMQDTNWEYTYKTESPRPLVITKTKAKIFYKKQEINLNVFPVMQNGNLLIPVEGVAEKLGLNAAVSDNKQTVLIKKDKTEIQITVDSSKAKVNNQNVELPSPIILINGNIMVPVKFICEKFGYKLNLEYDWKQSPSLNNTIRISKVIITDK